jgi:SAM-dependent methyltransferase
MTDVRNPEFWIRTWEDLSRAGGEGHAHGYAAAATWNQMAPSYGRPESGDAPGAPREDPAFRVLDAHGVALKGARVLDVGCGAGRHAFEFARRGAEVWALDFSTAMLDRLRRETPTELADRIHPVEADWERVDLAARGWESAFDLVFAVMTPAVRTPQSFLRLHAASRGRVLYRSWAGRRVHPVLDRIREDLGLPRPARGAWNLPLAFNLLFARGVFADVSFDALSFERVETVEEASAFFTTLFEGHDGLPAGEKKRRIEAVLEEVSEDGRVRRKTAGRTGTMTWTVDDATAFEERNER